MKVCEYLTAMMKGTLTYLILLNLVEILLLKCLTVKSCQPGNRYSAEDNGGLKFVRYERYDLLALRNSGDVTLHLDLPSECVRSDTSNSKNAKKTRKRGKRGGVRRRILNRPNKPPLPTVLLANVRSLRNKINELDSCVK